MTTQPPSWESMCGDLPDHAGEIMASHPGQPTLAEQDRSHGIGLPEPDYGVPDALKYT